MNGFVAAAAPDETADAFATALRACLDAPDPDAALLGFAPELPRGALLPQGQGLHGGVTPPQLSGFAAWLVANALIAKGRGAEVQGLLIRFADLFTPDHSQGEGLYSYCVPKFPYLYKPIIDLALEEGDQSKLIDLVLQAKSVRHLPPATHSADPLVADLLAHPNAARFGGLDIAPAWLLDRQERIAALGPMDWTRERVQEFQALQIESALCAEEPERALPLIEERLPDYLAGAAPGDSHFEFDAICVFAALGRFDEALVTARALVRRGYGLAWRFNLASAAEMGWTQEMRQNEWLGPLAETEPYRRFMHEEVERTPHDEKDPAQNPFCFVRDGELGGKKRKRCFVSRKFIEPGEPVVRIRRLFERAGDGGFEIAAKGAFEASPWQEVRWQFETETVPLVALFPRRWTQLASWECPEIAAFDHDLVRRPEAFDLVHAVEIIAEDEQPPISYSWSKGPGQHDRWAYAFDPYAGDNGHGDAVNFAWRLIRAGHRDGIVRLAGELPDEKADKVFAMLATFADDGLRQAAARHFGRPDLPDVIALAFTDRLSFESHARLAEYGGAEPRFRAGLVAAMRAYGLHIYSNYRPTVDWFLQGLEHYVMAGGGQLLFFLIDHPEDDPILATMLEKVWLPDRAGGSIDAYRNTQPFYLRTALLHLARHAPERLADWLGQAWIRESHDSPKQRETMRLLKTWMPK